MTTDLEKKIAIILTATLPHDVHDKDIEVAAQAILHLFKERERELGGGGGRNHRTETPENLS